MNFSYFTSIGSPGALCRKSDFERLTHLPVVEKLIKDFRAGDVGAKKKLPAFNFHAYFPNGVRKSANAVPSFMYMVDFDHLTEEEMKQIITVATPRSDQKDTTPIFLIHITPSGKGLRIVAKATKAGVFASCQSISDYQHTLAQMLKCEHKLDEVVTDLARLSFVPWWKDIVYFNDRLFSDLPEITEFAPSAPHHSNSIAAPLAAVPTIFPESTQTAFDGVPLDDIFREYIAITGGMPQEGGRNSRYYAAARDLRYICDFNPRVVAAHLPDVGLSATEVFQICVSACQSTRASCNPAPPCVMRAISIARLKDEEEDEEEEFSSYSPLSSQQFFPAIARDYIRLSPEDFKEAILLSLLPIIGTLATKVRARYIDGELHSPSFFTVVNSEQASGKSFARRLVKQLLASIAQEDAEERAKEQAYREELKVKKNAKELPEPPYVKIRIVPASISIAKLLQRLDFAKGEHLFTFCEEMDTIIKSNRSGAWSQKNDTYRNGFDNSEYGQDFMSESSYSANLAVYYNLLVLGTPRQVDRFFVDVENGLASRCCFATIADQFGAKMPHFQSMDDAGKLRIENAVKILRAASGEYHLEFLHKPLEEWLEKHRVLALQENNHARDIFRRRAAVIGFRAALCFAPLYNLNKTKIREKLASFALFVAELVLRNQLAFAGERLNTVIDSSRYGETSDKISPSQSVFYALPQEFNVAMLAEELRKRKMRTPPRQIVYMWYREQMIEKMENKKYRKKAS